MKHIFNSITLIAIINVISSFTCHAMDALSLQEPVKQTRHDEQQQTILASLKSAHTKNDTRTFEDLITKLQPAQLKPMWPALRKMTTFQSPPDESIPSKNPKFSYLLSDYNTKHESLVHSAAQKGDLAALKGLLSKEKNLNLLNLDGETPLFTAVSAHKIEAIKTLLNCGADPLIEISTGVGPLHISNNAEITQLLYNHGARAHLNHQDAFGQTPLLYAISRGNHAVAAQLIDLGADTNFGNVCGETPLHGTSTYDKTKSYQADAFRMMCEKLLAARANVNAQGNDLSTPLHIAAQDKLIPLIELFLNHGADATLKDRWGRTPAAFIQKAWDVTPEEFMVICRQGNSKDILSKKARAIMQQSFDFQGPANPKVKEKTTGKRGKKKAKNNRPTYAQHQDKKNQEKNSPNPSAAVPAQAPATSPLVIIQPSAVVRKQAVTLILSDRVNRWWDDTWLDNQKQKAEETGCYEYWQFLRKRLYHRLPERMLPMLMEYGTPEPRPNQTHKDHMDTQYILEGEMQFKNLDNPWKPGKQRQPGFYHMTRGIDDKIYHIGFKPIQNRGLLLSDFMPEEQIPVEWLDKEASLYSAVYDPNESVRHVLYHK